MSDATNQLVYFLLVDDREPNLIALEALLRRDGLSLLKARSGREALELLLKYEVALALIDVQMPGMDGFELAELMRGTERTRRVPIIFITAINANQQRRFRGYEAGAVDFLQKPIETDILKSKTGVFFDLYRQRQEVARQRDELSVIIVENKRLLEESRHAAHALQEADRRKDEFLATLAHELRNPLAPILSAVQLLRMSTESNQSDEISEVYEIVERQVDHMVHLVDDLLEVSRITSGRIQLKQHLLDLAQVVRIAVETSRPLIEAANHDFTIDMKSTPIMIEGDMVRLTQVVSNLLNNAAKYTPAGGKITLKVERQNQMASISIKDNGLGIPESMLGRVFDLFSQVNRHLNRSQGGLGIGLTLVKRLVELHSGTVTVISEGEGQGKGSEFIVKFPIATRVSEAKTPRKEKEIITTDEKLRVVIIDDNVDGLNSLKMLLSALGHDVQTAFTGQSGLDIIESFLPQVVLLDIGMPDMDGYETARILRSKPWGEDILLIAVTGWGDEEDRNDTMEAGFDFHVVKPVGMTSIQEIFKTLPHLKSAENDDFTNPNSGSTSGT